MKIRHLSIKNFRGIRSLEWTITSDFICLIGPGDSTKTTILSAIEFALYPYWNPSFDDSDFFNCDTTKPILIQVTIADLPEKLTLEDKFGLDLRGLNDSNELHDEPQDGDELALTIQLCIDDSLEPEWRVYTDRKPDGKRISHRDRESLGMVRLGSYVDRHLTWGRGTVLSRLTGKIEELPALIAKAQRDLRTSFNTSQMPELEEARKAAIDAARLFGISARNEYTTDLDTKSIKFSEGGIALHDGKIPVRMAGLGSKRLLTIALQRSTANQAGITLIDELEHGLEPHRIIRLIKALRNTGEEQFGQTILTSHSPDVVCEMKVQELLLIRSAGGVTKIIEISTDIQNIVRSQPHAFLARNILVCEGKTEIGICRALDTSWIEEGDESLAYRGVVPVDGGGSECAKRAEIFKKLGYKVALFADSDVELRPRRDELEAGEIRVIAWNDEFAVEQRVVKSLPWEGVKEVVAVAIEEFGIKAVTARVKKELEDDVDLPENHDEWEDTANLRNAIAKAAKKNEKKSRGWFKQIALGEKLGNVVVRHFASIEVTDDLIVKLNALRQWIHTDD